MYGNQQSKPDPYRNRRPNNVGASEFLSLPPSNERQRNDDHRKGIGHQPYQRTSDRELIRLESHVTRQGQHTGNGVAATEHPDMGALSAPYRAGKQIPSRPQHLRQHLFLVSSCGEHTVQGEPFILHLNTYKDNYIIFCYKMQ